MEDGGMILYTNSRANQQLVEVDECSGDDSSVTSESDPLIELRTADDFEFLPN
jgi:hypothetical protein